MQDALLYSTSNQMQRRDAAVALDAVVPAMEWGQEERVLDIGSGSGDVTVSLLSQSIPVKHRMVGLDCSKEMVEFANESYGSQDVSFHCMDISKEQRARVSFPSGFTKVFSFYCLHWVTELDQTMENVYSLLQEGGEGMLLFLTSNPIFRMYRILARNIKWSQYMKDVELYMPVYQDSSNPGEEFKTILQRTGFHIRRCEVKEHSFTFKNQNQLLAALKAVNPFLLRIPKDKQQEYMMDCLSTLSTIDKPFKNGRAEARYKLLLAHIQKPKRKIA